MLARDTDRMTEGGLGIHGVRAVMVFSADPDASSRWWADIMGVPTHAEGRFRWIDVPGGVELGFHPADTAKNPPGASTVPYWRVDSLHATVQRVTGAGGTLHRGPLDIEDGRRICQVRDPFGLVMGFDGLS